MQKFGIDISRWQGKFDLASARENYGIEYAILKAGGSDGGKYADKMFQRNYDECKKLGIPCGCYFFGNEYSTIEAEKSAQYFLSLIKGKQFEYPIYYDVEGSMITKNTMTDLVKIVDTFCKILQDEGYCTGIYTSESVFNAGLKGLNYTRWIAKWSTSQPRLQCDMWQYGGETNFIRSCKINGQTVDQDFCFVDFPSIMREKGLNGFEKAEVIIPTPQEKKPVFDEIKTDKGIPMYRMYNANSGEHFFATEYAEAVELFNVGWQYEGVAFISAFNGVPIHRLYNPIAGDHHYTVDNTEKDNLISVGWNYEGVSCLSGGDIPIYRLYNPNATSGAHHFTKHTSERDYLISQGWKDEGIAFYCVQ